MRKLRYLVIVEKDPGTDWGASVPDLPGCIATASSLDAVVRRIREAVVLHLEGLREDGLEPPAPRHQVVLPRASDEGFTLYATVEVAG